MRETAPETCGPPAAGRLVVELDPRSQAAGQARHAARELLDRWQLSRLVDAVALVVSELVTNAVRHGAPPVRLVLSRIGERVQIAVHDAAAAASASPDTGGQDAESGRGLLLVRAVADEVAVQQVPDNGKVVQALVSG